MDRYIWNRETSLDASNVQLVGAAAILIGTKIEEYYHANVKELWKLTANSCTPTQIKNMEMKVLQGLGFSTYSLDPVIYINRFIVAAQREEDILFREACLLCLDCYCKVATILGTLFFYFLFWSNCRIFCCRRG